MKITNRDLLRITNKTEAIAILAITLAAIVLIFYKNNNSLIEWDESIYAEVSKEILLYNDWVTLHWNYYQWFHKPPLYMWLTAISYEIFGVNEFSARLFSGIFSIGGILVTYFLGKNLYNRYVGLLSAIILLTTAQYLFSSRLCMLDVPITFFISASILFFWLALNRNNKLFILYGCFVGLAIMTKGVVGFLPVFITFPFLAIQSPRTFRDEYLIKGCLAAILIATPWHLAQLFLHNGDFINEYLIYHVISRVTEGLEGNGHGIGLYYFINLYREFYPYCFIIPFSGLDNVKTYLENKNSSDLLIVLWIFVIFFIFTIAQTKLTWYIIPAYPALSISVANFLYKLYQQKDRLIIAGMFTSIVLWIGSIGSIPYPPSIFGLISGLIIALIIFFIIFVMAKDHKKNLSAILILVFIISCIQFPYRAEYPANSIDEDNNIRSIFQDAEYMDQRDSINVIYLYNNSLIRTPVIFYSNKKLVEIGRNNLDCLTNGTDWNCIIAEKDISDIKTIKYKTLSQQGEIYLIAPQMDGSK
jgi:hypothetical protein